MASLTQLRQLSLDFDARPGGNLRRNVPVEQFARRPADRTDTKKIAQFAVDQRRADRLGARRDPGLERV